MARSLNRVQLIGNLTRDPELRYTPTGTAVCTFGLATNRQWVTEAGEKKEEVEFHRIVAWQKLAELCAQLLTKGRKVYIEGRLQTRRWTAPDGTERVSHEIVASDMILLDSRAAAVAGGESFEVPEEEILPEEEIPVVDELRGSEESQATVSEEAKSNGKEKSDSQEEKAGEGDKKTETPPEADENEDIPF